MPVTSRAIPANHHAEVRALRASVNPATGRQWTVEDVAAKLNADHGLTCSHMAVVRLEQRLDAAGEALVVQALREELRDAVGPMVAQVVDATEKLSDLCKNEPRTDRLAAGVRALTASLDTFAKLAGVAAPIAVALTTQSLADVSDDELDRRIAVAERRRAGATDPTDG